MKVAIEKADGKFIVTCETPPEPPFQKTQIKDSIAGALIVVNEMLSFPADKTTP